MLNMRSAAQDVDNLRLAVVAGRESLDPSSQVGGLILTPEGTRHTRCNEFLSLRAADLAAGPDATREARYADVLHAEENLLLELGASRAFDGWYYGTHEPCGRCWKLLDRMGIERVVFIRTSAERRQRWCCDDPGAAQARRNIEARGGVVVFETVPSP